MRLFWPPGPPKRSIVMNLVPKTTPKWSPKRSQIEKGRPSRNIGRHCPNTYFTLSWELRFRCFFGVCKKVTKKLIKNYRFRKMSPKWSQNGPKNTVSDVANFALFSSRNPFWLQNGAGALPRTPRTPPNLDFCEFGSIFCGFWEDFGLSEPSPLLGKKRP